MWLLVKYEFKYNWYTYALLAILALLYTFFNVIDFELLYNKKFEIDYWGGLYSFFLIIFTFSIWGTRFKEKRNRFFNTLPVSTKDLAVSRFLFATIPFSVIVLYLLIFHPVFVKTGHHESNSVLTQIGIMFALFAGFIRGRDDWFSHWSFNNRIQYAFVTAFIIQILVIIVFVTLPGTYGKLTPIFGESFYYYVKIIFYLLGFVIMITTIFSFIKRKSYLA